MLAAQIIVGFFSSSSCSRARARFRRPRRANENDYDDDDERHRGGTIEESAGVPVVPFVVETFDEFGKIVACEVPVQFLDLVSRSKLEPAATGKIHFELKTYAGKTVWQKSSAIDKPNQVANAVLTAKEADKLEKGSRVLVVTLNGNKEQSAYKAVRLRGRIFRNVIEAPKEIKGGDEIIITEMSLLQPQNINTKTSRKGKWWLRDYTTPGTAQKQSLVCVFEQDLDDLQSCMAPEITLPLNLEGGMKYG